MPGIGTFLDCVRPFLPPSLLGQQPDRLTLLGEHDALLLRPYPLIHTGGHRRFHLDTELSQLSRGWEAEVFMFYLLVCELK